MASTFISLPLEAGGGASGVSSFNTRTGGVIAQSGDYDATQVDFAPSGNISATDVQAAIQEVDSEKQATITGAATTVVSANLTVNSAVISNGSGKIAVSPTTSTELGYVHGVTSAIQDQIGALQVEIDSKEPTITGAATSIVSADLTASRALVSDGSGKVAAATTTATELGYVNGVTSAIQTQLNAKQATITGGATSIVSADLTASRALVSDGSGKVAAAAATTATELGYVSGVTSAIQTQLNAKQATITGGATSITSSDLTASRALVSDGSGKVAVAAATTATELGYVNGVTSALQTQLNAKQPLDSTLTSLAAYNTNGLVAQTAADTFAGRTLTGTSPIVVANGDGVSGNPTASFDYPSFYNISLYAAPIMDDFLVDSPGAESWAGGASGTGAAYTSVSQALSDSGHPGVLNITTGTTTTGNAYRSSNNATFNLNLGGGTTYYETIVKLSAASDGTDRFTVLVGMMDSTAGSPTNGIYFSYTDNVNSGNWVGVSKRAGVATSVNSSVAGGATFARLGWIANSAGTSVEFFVNGVSIG